MLVIITVRHSCKGYHALCLTNICIFDSVIGMLLNQLLQLCIFRCAQDCVESINLQPPPFMCTITIDANLVYSHLHFAAAPVRSESTVQAKQYYDNRLECSVIHANVNEFVPVIA